MIDRHLSDILPFQLARRVVLIQKCNSYFNSQTEIAGVSGQHICECYYCCHGNRSLNFKSLY